MAALIDIIAASIIGAVLLLICAVAMDNATQAFINNNVDAMTQLNLTTTTEIIQDDLRKMGYGISENQQSSILQTAQTDRVKFLTILDSDDAIADTITYQISVLDTFQMVDTFMVRYGVYRSALNSNSGANTTIVGTTSQNHAFRYLDQLGNQTGVLLAIRMVEVTLIDVNPSVYLSEEFIAATTAQERILAARAIMRESFWRQTRVISKNMRR